MTSEALIIYWRLGLENEERRQGEKLKPATIGCYISDARCFLEHLLNGQMEESVEAALPRVDQAWLRSFFGNLIKNRNYHIRTMERITVTVRRLFRFFVAQGWITANPLDGFRSDLSKSPPMKWVPLTPDLFERLRGLAKQKNSTRLPSRDLLILELMRLGMSASVLAKSTVGDISLVGDRLCWQQKSGRRQSAVVPEETRLVLQRYLDERTILMRRYNLEHDRLFIKWYARPLSGRQIRRRLWLLAKTGLGLIGFDVRQITCMAKTNNGQTGEGLAAVAMVGDR